MDRLMDWFTQTLAGKKKELLSRLEGVFERIQRDQNISAADFPDVDAFRKTLDRKDFAKFNPVKDKVVEDVERVVAMEISRCAGVHVRVQLGSLSKNLILDTVFSTF